jgi:hypothetical protein
MMRSNKKSEKVSGDPRARTLVIPLLRSNEMKLPNGESAIVDIGKLQGYCLNPHHSRGRNKARVFASVGIRQADAEELRTALLAAAGNAEATLGVANPFGQRYVVDFELVREGRTIKIRSTWIVRVEEDLPRPTSCYVL